MGKKRNPIKREEIIEYWKRHIDEKKINTTWDKALKECWGCGASDFGTLEKSHIIPECLGGSMKASNMVLLCHFCNSENPETIYFEDFWKWIKGRIRRGKGFVPLDKRYAIKDEYLMMYKVDLKTVFAKIAYYINHENIIPYLYNFLKKNRHKYLERYPSSTAIMISKFSEYVSENFVSKMEIPIE